MKEKLLSDLIRPVVEDLGFVFWGLEYLPQKGGALLRVYIDREQGITVDDCANCSHEISGVLEVEDPIKTAYVLEVSSPGIDRIMFSAEQFATYIGEHVAVKLAQAVNGARKVKGQITQVDGEKITVSNDSSEYCFEFNNIMKARLKPNIGGVK